MLDYIPFYRPLAAPNNRLAKYVLLPGRPSHIDKEPILTGLRPGLSFESRLPRDREDPCSFRTRLIDPLTGSDVDLTLGSTETLLSSDDFAFDDTQCVSVGRWTGKFMANPEIPTLWGPGRTQPNEAGIMKMDVAPHPSSAPADDAAPKDYEKLEPIEPAATDDTCRLAIAPFGGHQDRAVSQALSNSGNGEAGGSMEAMNMPFWDLPRRPKRHPARPADAIPDDMSVISDASLIPTYCPTDVARQQRPPPRALLVKRLIRAKARAARQAMRQLRRSCRDAVEHVFVEPAAHATTPSSSSSSSSSTTTKCFAVGLTQ
ncbi:hypothetical protein MYCTH_2296617 [Thermothelomyces thermophilus ATCC 42464]|uniref:Uncharacterized protein n=1 Tax=Thermothelomyces thermophilus (strain ATCC 42464 / BCRC 31852 / DSM 1799) TaxID=573729 RepID=G2Q2C6_THET4|nr:uncharacterized protein MYCTH_2296617 [Thermothelomyces thermophilus ATCC 42464]AEO54251.1 hypothetical protein MYCTH_2296617 [Thermothelomyces thermophilus ATCC 42464]